MKKIIILITIIILMGCVKSPVEPIDNTVPTFYEQSTIVSILNNSFNGVGVNVEYSIKNTGEMPIDTIFDMIIIQATNEDYISGDGLKQNISVGSTVTNNIFINTDNNNYTNILHNIISGYTTP